MLSTFADSGLERAAALEKDIAWFKEEGLEAPPLGSFGKAYAERLREIAAAGEWEVFVCHFYNFYFAHTAGGRMIGKQLSDAILDKKKLEFYKWDGVLKEHMDGVRKEINDMAEKWTQVCLQYISKSLHLSLCRRDRK